MNWAYAKNTADQQMQESVSETACRKRKEEGYGK